MNAAYANTADLKGITAKINILKKDITMTQSQREQLMHTLKIIDEHTTEITKALKAYEKNIADKQVILLKLQQQQQIQMKNLAVETKRLEQQLRASYQLGKYAYWQLLLNQQDPSNTLRYLTYSRYINASRVQTLIQIQKTQAEIRDNQQLSEAENEALNQLYQAAQQKKVRLNQERQARQAILNQLNHTIETQTSKLKAYESDKKNLETLVQRLEKSEKIKPKKISAPSSAPKLVPQAILQNVAPSAFTPKVPISQMAHHLMWPTNGKIMNPASLSYLRHTGVVILAPEGQTVVAVYPGKVVFADWLNGFGLLVIIDHGQGWMTLYAGNQTLVRQRGTVVKAGDMIAHVGHTGIFAQSGVYFEVRKNGKPLNPLQWLAQGVTK